MARLVDIIASNELYHWTLLPGRLSAEEEKGMKTSKETIVGLVFKDLFPKDTNAKGGGCKIKTKLQTLLAKYNELKKSIGQTGSGILLHNMTPDHSVS